MTSNLTTLPPGVPPLPEGATLDPPDEWAAFPRVNAQPTLPPGVPPLPEGATLDPPDEWAAFPKVQAPTWGDAAVDYGKSALAGLVKGAAHVGGMYGDFRDLVGAGVLAGGHALGLPDPDMSKVAQAPDLTRFIPNSADLTPKGAANYQPTTTGGKFIDSAAEFVPGALTPGGEGSMFAKLLKFGLAPGLASEGAGQLANAAGASPQTAGTVRLAASLAAPGLAGRVITPLPAGARLTADIAALRGEGVQPTAGQATGRRPLQYLEAQLTSDRNEQQANQFTRAAFNRVGMNVPDGMAPGAGGTVDRMLTDAGARYDGIAARNTLDLDPQGAQHLNDVGDRFLGTPGLYGADTENAVRGTLNRVHGLLQQGGGTIPGPDYVTLRSNLRAAARGAAPQTAEGLNDVVNALDSAFERGLPAGSPDAGALPAANSNYRNALVLERAATAAGTQPASGAITPANLANAAKAVYGKRTYIRGQDDFSALANPAVASLKVLPDSGTAHRAAISGALAAIGGGAGYALGSKYNTDTGNDSPVSGLLLGEGLGGAILPRLLGRPAIMNPATQAYLRNQAMARTPGLLSLPGALTATTGARGLLTPPGQ